MDQAAQPSVDFDVFDLKLSDASYPQREAYRRRDRPLSALQRPQRLLEQIAVDLDPPVAEKNERRALIKQKTDFSGAQLARPYIIPEINT